MFGKIFACFLLVKFVIDVVVIALRGLEIREISGATFGFVRFMLGATFHLFVISLQTPMYETDENKNNDNLRIQNVTGNETLAAPMYEENPTSLYAHVHFVNNPIPISSNLTEPQGNDPNVFHSSGNAPLNSIVSTHGNAPSTSNAFWINSIDRITPKTSNTGNASKSNGNAPLTPPFFCNFTKKETRKIEKKGKNRKQKKTFT